MRRKDVAERSLADALRRPAYLAALALLGLVCPLSSDAGALLLSAEAAAASRKPQQIGGTWDATWRNSRGAPRKGLIVVDQRGDQLSARIVDRGNVTATGSIEGSAFTLRGTRLGVPFTITGRVQGRKMSGSLTAILTDRRFTATRRRGR
jgi:hypothetical protein